MIKQFKCWIFGHKFIQLSYESAPNGWWYERYKCSNCGIITRELVASKLG